MVSVAEIVMHDVILIHESHGYTEVSTEMLPAELQTLQTDGDLEVLK